MKSLQLPHFHLSIFHLSIFHVVQGCNREYENEKQCQIPNPNLSGWRGIFPNHQLHLVQICLALVDLHPCTIHRASQPILLVKSSGSYSVPDLCSYEVHNMAVTHMGSSPVPLEKPPPPSFHHTMLKWVQLYKT